jgi:hypothetical protein
MNIIDFPGNAGRKPESLMERATRLKQSLVSFVHEGAMQVAFEEELQSRGLEPLEGYALIDFTDWFIFEWEGDDGQCVLDEFIDANPELADEDVEILEGWYEAIDDVFEIVGREGDGFLVRDEEGDEYLVVPTAMSAAGLPWSPGLHVSTRILPVGDAYMLSGIQSTATSRDSLLGTDEQDIDVDSIIGEILTDAFVEFFHGREVLVPAREVGDRLKSFYEFLFRDYQPKGADRPFGELLRNNGEPLPDIEMPDIAVPDEALDIEVGLLADPDEGLAVVPYYGAVRRYVADGEGNVDELREIILDMLEDDEVPPFVFYMLADISGGRFGALLGEALDDPSFDLESDLDDLLEEFKPAPEDELPDLESALVDRESLEDVRDVTQFEAFPGSLAEALAAYASKLESTLKPAAFAKHIEGINLLGRYGREAGIDQLSGLDLDALRDFLCVWYVRRWAERSVDGIKNLLGTIEKLTAWLDKNRHTSIGAAYKKRLVPEFAESLPRILGAVAAMDDAFDATLETALESLEEALEGGAEIEEPVGDPLDAVCLRAFSVLAVDGNLVRVEERPSLDPDADRDDESDEEIGEVFLPEHVAGFLRAGDVFEAEVTDTERGWTVVTFVGAYPAGAV